VTLQAGGQLFESPRLQEPSEALRSQAPPPRAARWGAPWWLPPPRATSTRTSDYEPPQPPAHRMAHPPHTSAHTSDGARLDRPQRMAMPPQPAHGSTSVTAVDSILGHWDRADEAARRCSPRQRCQRPLRCGWSVGDPARPLCDITASRERTTPGADLTTSLTSTAWVRGPAPTRW